MKGGFTAVTDNYDHYANFAAFPVLGDKEKLYLAEDTEFLYRWNGTAYVGVTISSANVSKVGTPVDNQVGVWTGDGTIEGTTGFTYDGSNLQLTGDVGSTGTRITKVWAIDIEATNAIAGDITGNLDVVVTVDWVTAKANNTISIHQGFMEYKN